MSQISVGWTAKDAQLSRKHREKESSVVAKLTHSSLLNSILCLFFWVCNFLSTGPGKVLTRYSCVMLGSLLLRWILQHFIHLLLAQMSASLIMEYTLDVNADKWTSQCPAKEAKWVSVQLSCTLITPLFWSGFSHWSSVHLNERDYWKKEIILLVSRVYGRYVFTQCIFSFPASI